MRGCRSTLGRFLRFLEPERERAPIYRAAGSRLQKALMVSGIAKDIEYAQRRRYGAPLQGVLQVMLQFLLAEIVLKRITACKYAVAKSDRLDRVDWRADQSRN